MEKKQCVKLGFFEDREEVVEGHHEVGYEGVLFVEEFLAFGFQAGIVK